MPAATGGCSAAELDPLFNGIGIRDPPWPRHADGLTSVARANPDRSRHRVWGQSFCPGCLVLQSPIP